MEGGPFAIETGELAMRKPAVAASENYLERIKKMFLGR